MDQEQIEFHKKLHKLLEDTQRRLEEASQKMQKFIEEVYLDK